MIDLRLGDCLAILPTLDAGSVDSVVTDPPYGLGFMGKRWDASLPSLRVWDECYRVMKPGSYLMAFGGTRTFHRLIGSIEDAGFEIRDCLMWLYGSGFPKGKGCLKPAWEPITLARKPGGKVKPLGIEECRVATNGEKTAHPPLSTNKHEGYQRPWNEDRSARAAIAARREEAHAKLDDIGRWPPNLLLQHHPECNGVCHPECVVSALGEQSGERPNGYRSHPCKINQVAFNTIGKESRETRGERGHDDSGTAARFFPQFRYEAKASREERNAGCEGMKETIGGSLNRAIHGDSRVGKQRSDGAVQNASTTVQANTHPTVKPLAVMEWLVKLACPEGGTVLDPFMGSGTTGVACEKLGRSFIGIDDDPQWLPIAQKRIAAEQAKMSLFAGLEV